MNLDKYKFQMGELSSSIKELIKQEIKYREFLGYKYANRIHKEEKFSVGICRDSRGAVLVTCITEMTEVTPKMIDWWFGWHMPESERYQLWHPQDHISSKLKIDNSN